MRKLLWPAALTICTVALAGQTITAAQAQGNWTGKFVMDLSKLAAKDQKAYSRVKSEMEAIRINLNLGAGGKFSAKMSDGKRTQSSTGTWRIENSTLVTRDLVNDGKPVAPAKQKDEKVKIVALVGKKMSLQVPGAPPGTLIVLTK